ncbi:zinc ABC transporter substrate-binding protein ZnuA [Vibrio aestuarianus]|uniref:High-affinity zinc uptake system protein ZnuA n=1 Tax=Vibrio aestuarianus TaxID=28171 RepID=A0A9X4FDH5_9VIBR|nr:MULTISPECIES: zinc ABC transporter substrate-binding protein ZnuA [Vibrio]MDE1310566.1 zinc ABC transporter substrate-binding protein ZnuA [Vibrio aestuarianus]MDE1314863.1 zinc ABC transporter substrate-binding protein ZnuA [Vibrio aestuarianus]MDE1331243.1 zinc ABC transporter substrate-binding protein ZnuA [Vibrio aestuarianus]MDE1355868.1 zinc ABC transporter substrate-binding protein ZnuA [Vibrio aestuarianus]MDF9399839.1 zinc ABC transporter substrate-binding protein ZnuA [Vibrio sp. 
MLRQIAYCLCLATLSPLVWANTVLTSIKPIQMITFELTKGVTEPTVLLGSNTSPHDYAMRPSDVKKIRAADLVIWYGEDLEPFLSKTLQAHHNVLTISQIPELKLREFSGDHHDHDHDGHNHGTHDPHFWLGVEQAKQVASAITERLKSTDVDNALLYQANLESFLNEIAITNRNIVQQLSSVKHKGYYVFHDAYGYFEQQYQLNNMGHFTVSPDRKPGAKTLINIKNSLAKNEAKCVFSEPQFTPAVIDTVTRGSQVNSGVLDPLGMDIDVKSGSYFELLNQLSNSIYGCLSE